MGTDYDVIKLRSQLRVLKEIAKDYQGKTIENIIQQIYSRLSTIGVIKIKEIVK